ncbi:sterol desaturase family protein [Roseateles terrae]|uniref:Sterol desaturase/sphingolipid hydroxylase (Fatty acid hydroxylase superfamily) n=1 Tax=Roseateles terrae TaxID=431060 RepID=A0ABR6GY38_9BURK|nr:sterol desaturase family protein [Roseateles terrae]MBB3197013.1 sterol desaturase/sphingolipid hydroxylase (fatty acid hydroxylase superfamily) [Roseateles terrae]OWQ84182.1 fatty acid hydroxylase [Roseateles terrae]
MDWFTDLFGQAQQALFEAVVQPLVFGMGFGNLLEDAFDATGWLLVGLLQMAVMLVVIGSLQRWRPAEPVTDRRAIRVDVIYTLIQRLGLFRLVMFFTLEPAADAVTGQLRLWGIPTFQLDAVWPGVTDIAWVSFVLYLIAFDLLNYWLHRAQHQWHWWWSLHSLHHSQRQMTMWSDSRNHLLDDLLIDCAVVLVARLIGVGPGQFVALVALSQLLENLQHANLRLSFGRFGERLLVSPRFHRLHHSIGIGHEGFGAGTLGGHNFAVLFPIWDVMFRTANFEDRWDPTGVRDQLPDEGNREYGQGFWAQQWLGLRRLFGRDRAPHHTSHTGSAQKHHTAQVGPGPQVADTQPLSTGGDD